MTNEAGIEPVSLGLNLKKIFILYILKHVIVLNRSCIFNECLNLLCNLFYCLQGSFFLSGAFEPIHIKSVFLIDMKPLIQRAFII